MTNERNLLRRRIADEELSRDEYITSCVDAALAPLKRYLSSWQTRLVRSIVQANIEADPVSRRLLANAVRARFRSQWRASRRKGGKASAKKPRGF